MDHGFAVMMRLMNCFEKIYELGTDLIICNNRLC